MNNEVSVEPILEEGSKQKALKMIYLTIGKKVSFHLIWGQSLKIPHCLASESPSIQNYNHISIMAILTHRYTHFLESACVFNSLYINVLVEIRTEVFCFGISHKLQESVATANHTECTETRNTTTLGGNLILHCYSFNNWVLVARNTRKKRFLEEGCYVLHFSTGRGGKYYLVALWNLYWFAVVLSSFVCRRNWQKKRT